ncbi:hypothetical protein EVAR_38160_1 [Eumeta japonica]|uniref:Uncharacterized protein n=1 Tax=Eumeta variegata TaxID=151549 RepID=A0A4C1ZKS7_EUMVA|nr:hypothetical protein EVAR_38160_1 [Eumeta japonica]
MRTTRATAVIFENYVGTRARALRPPRSWLMRIRKSDFEFAFGKPRNLPLLSGSRRLPHLEEAGPFIRARGRGRRPGRGPTVRLLSLRKLDTTRPSRSATRPRRARIELLLQLLLTIPILSLSTNYTPKPSRRSLIRLRLLCSLSGPRGMQVTSSAELEQHSTDTIKRSSRRNSPRARPSPPAARRAHLTCQLLEGEELDLLLFAHPNL